MSIYLISGVSGSGKTTIGHELRSRGSRIVETDSDRALSGWRVRATGERAIEKPVYPLSAEWLREHEWSWDKNRMRAILDEKDTGPLFICGGASNERDFFSWFTRMFVLIIKNEVLAKRLQVREPRRWITNSAELNRLFEYNDYFTSFSQKSGMIPIDSDRPPAMIADEILEMVRRDQ
ncbi:AAA family ATPase [Taklimakanibacter lacteus]|uniref:AAA family ATPase n=1 Tax=Taklimakanibacter lacteus TaxID=2268456 RepID=UPI000E66652B